ncbi:hypothetical protein QQF64_022957, partial [Cirrhinus molitorella]
MLSAPRTEDRRSAYPSSCLCRAPNDTHMLVRAPSTQSPRGQANCCLSFARSAQAD